MKTKKPTISLAEYQTTTAVSLSSETRDRLAERVPSLSISPSRGMPGHWDLTPGAVVGVIDLGPLVIDIHPKLPVDRLLFLLSYSFHSGEWFDEQVDLQHAEGVLDAVVPTLSFHLRRAFRTGILQGYQVVKESLSGVRGRIRFADQIRDRFGIFPPVEVRYDEFTEDILENRLLKSAIHRLRRLPLRSSESRRMLRAFDGVLANVANIEFDTRHIPEIHYTRLNEHYRPAVELSRLILQSISFDQGVGTMVSTAFLLNMNEVFENFVVASLRDALDSSLGTFSHEAKEHSLYLDAEKRIRLKPDISLWLDARCQFVGDVKYKQSKSLGGTHPDLYQLLAYTVATDLPSGLLVYAAGEGEPVKHVVPLAGKLLQVVTLDLDVRPALLLERIREIASGIRKEIRSLPSLRQPVAVVSDQ